MRIVLLGDSHLAHVQEDLHRIGSDVVNAAVGGSIVLDLPEQARGVGLRPDDTVVVSIGTNDAATWRPEDPDTFEQHLSAFVEHLEVARLVLVTTPGVDLERKDDATVEFAHALGEHARVATAIFTAARAEVIDASALVEPVGAGAFLDDGLHLAPAGYDVVLPAIAEAVGSGG